MIFDIDFFKKISDTHGHGVGDDVLKSLVHVVFENIRQEDLLARWGGEEFMILMPQTTLKAAFDLAERLRKNIEKHEFSKVGKVTVSLGLAEYSSEDNIESFIKRADDALYLAKGQGRNRVEFSP
jgi:diguanylate cyclase (GGDEF)-like protein